MGKAPGSFNMVWAGFLPAGMLYSLVKSCKALPPPQAKRPTVGEAQASRLLTLEGNDMGGCNLVQEQNSRTMHIYIYIYISIPGIFVSHSQNFLF